jgi:hypothetical protein
MITRRVYGAQSVCPARIRVNPASQAETGTASRADEVRDTELVINGALEENRASWTRRREGEARNEALFREVNERVEELEADLPGPAVDDAHPIGFVCECPDKGCGETIELTRSQYEAVRADPRHFLVLPGHAKTGVEKVIERHAGYLVVEKFGEAAEITAEQDPRSRQ